MKKKYNKLISWLIYALAIGYLFLPTDLIPDIPIVGLIDDAIALTGAKVIDGLLNRKTK